MSNSSSSASSVNSFYTSNGTTRLNGSSLVSGLDTQNLIKALTAHTQNKIDKQGQLEQKAEWKEEMYQDVETLMQTLSSTYFSYTSDTNMLSPSFFDSDGLISSINGIVNATGSASNAGNVVIDSVSQLASAASVASGKSISDENITSGDIRSSWKQSLIGGQTVVVNYGGNDYNLTISRSYTLDDGTDPATVTKNANTIADALNSQIAGNSALNGKIKFSVGSDNKSLMLSSLAAPGDAPCSVTIKAYKASNDDTSGIGFLEALGFSGNDYGTTGTSITGSPISMNTLFNQSVSSSSFLNIKVGSDTYALKVGNTIDLTGCTGAQATTKLANQLKAALNYPENSVLRGKINIATGSDGSIQFTPVTTGTPVSVTGGSENLMEGFGLKSNYSSAVTPTASCSVSDANIPKIEASYLTDALAGSTVTFNLDGVQKKISFDASSSANYSTADGIASYLQTKLDAAFGNGKVSVSTVADNGKQKLSFTTADSTSVLTVFSADTANVLEKDGALRISSGETNRVETTKSLGDLMGEIKGLTVGADGKFSFSINGKAFSFDKDTELGTVINTVNSDSDANVTLSYNKTSNTFRMTSDDTGAQQQITPTDTGGNLISSLLGTNYFNVANSLYTNKSGAIGSVNAPNNSVYNISYNGGTAQPITINSGTYNSMADLAKVVQSSVDAAFGGSKIAVGVSSDGTALTFKSTDGTSTIGITNAGGDNILGTVTGSGSHSVTSGSIATDNSVSTGSSDSVYSFQIGNGNIQNVTITANQTFNSIDNLKTAVQNAINANAELNGKITVGTNGNRLVFTTPGGSNVTAGYVSGNDVLGVSSNLSTSSTLADLYANGIAGVTYTNGSGYSVDGGKTYLSGNTVLKTIGQNIQKSGTDFVMKVKLDGSTTETTIDRSTNSFSLEGLSLNFTNTYNISDDSSVAPIKFTTSNDTDTLYKNICGFIDDYNKVIGKANTYTTQLPYGLNPDSGTNTKYDPLTDAQKTDMSSDDITKWNDKAKEGLLENDSTLNGIIDDFRNVISSTVASVGISLDDIGISVTTDASNGGQINIDKTKFQNYVKSNPDKVTQLFTNTDGIANQLKSRIDKYIAYGTGKLIVVAGSGGTAAQSTNTSQLGQQISGYETNIKDLKSQLKDEQDRWTDKFSEMESKLSVLNNQYSYLSSMLGGSGS